MKTSDAISEAQGWCPECQGTGMVMRFDPTDCPNLDVHRALADLGGNEA